MLWRNSKGKTTEPAVVHRNYLLLGALFFFLAAAGATGAAAAAAAALSALLAKEQLARPKMVTNYCEDLLVFLLEFLRFRFSRMVSFASNKAFFAAASVVTAMVTVSHARLRRKQHTVEHKRTFHCL
jgi:hypothetical protein